MRLVCFGLDKAINLADKSRNPSGKISGIFVLEGRSNLTECFSVLEC